MRKLLYFISLSVLFISCNDGDIIDFELGFDDIETVKSCGDLVLYKIKEEPFESLSLQLNTSLESLINDYDNSDGISTFQLSDSNTSFIYRSYAEPYSSEVANNLFCNDVPPNVSIITDAESQEGVVIVTTSLVEDDNDGIPAELEDLNGNGNLDDDDTDGDGIPTSLADDDDGSNVLTADERPNYSAQTGLEDALNTDAEFENGDAIPDYLDPDDDADGVLTIDEENESQDQNPLNDISEPGNGPDFRNPNVNTLQPATAYRIHNIRQNYAIQISVSNFSLPELTQQNLDFGTMAITTSPCPCVRQVEIDFN